MRLSILGAAALVLAASAAWAADDPLSNSYGNTLVVIDKGGMESHTHYNADHTFNGIVPSMNYKYQGTWAIDATGHVCRTFDPPVMGRSNPDCDSDPLGGTQHAVGDKWTSPDGSTVSLVAGQN